MPKASPIAALVLTGHHCDSAIPLHQLALICGDPGMIIQRVIVDWGGLKQSYVGPSTN